LEASRLVEEHLETFRPFWKVFDCLGSILEFL